MEALHQATCKGRCEDACYRSVYRIIPASPHRLQALSRTRIESGTKGATTSIQLYTHICIYFIRIIYFHRPIPETPRCLILLFRSWLNICPPLESRTKDPLDLALRKLKCSCKILSYFKLNMLRSHIELLQYVYIYIVYKCA